MELGDSVIVGSFLSLLGMIIILELNNRNWFKRENFKLERDNVKATNRLNLKKLEKEMGLTKTPSVKASQQETSNPMSMLAPIVKQLSADQLKGLADMFLGNYSDSEEPPIEEGGLADILLEQAEAHPELAKAVLNQVIPAITKNNINDKTDMTY